MARVILDGDRIVAIAPHGSLEGVEVGHLPRGVSLSQLRWTGSELVDLATLDTLHVEPETHAIHAHAVPGSQPVAMRYADRGRLVTEGGVVRLRTDSDRLEMARAAKLTAIIAGADVAGKLIYQGYSKLEQDSWPEQRADAEALLADPAAPAPLLRAMAQERGIDVLELRDKVLANVECARTISASIMGQQQARETMAREAASIDELEAIPDAPQSYNIPEVMT